MVNPVLTEMHGSTCVITMHDPARLNPISDAMRAALLTDVELAMTDRNVRAMVIHGAGGNFSSGSDVRQLTSPDGPDPARSWRRLSPLHRVIELIAGGPKPVIAAVDGAAFGAGLSIAAASDFVVAGDDARFGAAFGKIGLTADCGLIWSLPQRIGRSSARDLLFSGRQIDAREAHAIGLVDMIVPAGSALQSALNKAADYAAVAPLSIAAMKAAFVQGPNSLTEVLALERQQQPMLCLSRDHAEGVDAFLQKRTAKFTGC